MKSVIRLVPGALAVLICVAASLSREARACSYNYSCEAYRVGFAPEGEAVPANVGSLKVHWEPVRDGARVPDPLDGGVELVRKDGGAVPISVEPGGAAGWFLVHPRAPLDEGEPITFRLWNPCWRPPEDAGSIIDLSGNQALEGGRQVLESTFTPGPVAPPPPATAGTLTVAEQGVGVVRAETTCGSCSREVRAAFARLRFTPAPGLVPWLPLTDFSLRVDGQPGEANPYGPRPHGGSSYPELYSHCEPDGNGSTGLPLGDHMASLSIHVAGAASDPPPLTVPFRLSCDGFEAVPRPKDACGRRPVRVEVMDDGEPPLPRPPSRCGGLSAGALVLGAALVGRRRARG